VNDGCFVHPKLGRFVCFGVVVDVVYAVVRYSDVVGSWRFSLIACTGLGK
jgi:hypothetical protein